MVLDRFFCITSLHSGIWRARMPEDSQEMDSEAIQSQIEFSFSLAYDMVSSWMKKPTTAHQIEPGSAIREAQKEERGREIYVPTAKVRTFFFLCIPF
jgi:hypothetical protein